MQNYVKQINKIFQLNAYYLKNKNQFYSLFNKTHLNLYKYHIKNSNMYKLMQNGIKHNLKKLPFLPIRIFKEIELMSIPKKKIFKILLSSGTSGVQSKIFLSKYNSSIQTKVLSKLFQDFFNIKERRPMIIFDRSNIIKDRNLFSARGAGILGFSIFGKDHIYAFDENNKFRKNEIINYLKKYKKEKIIVFGLTNIVWENLENLKNENFIKENLKDSILIHGGGWKKLSVNNISQNKFKKTLKQRLGITSVYNYYGMVEQTGSIFFECEKGYFHTSTFSDIKTIDKYFNELNYGKRGIIQLISLLPTSYPGHNLLTEDEGIIYGKDTCSCKRHGKYFKIIGRIKRSETRGCSDNYDL